MDFFFSFREHRQEIQCYFVTKIFFCLNFSMISNNCFAIQEIAYFVGVFLSSFFVVGYVLSRKNALKSIHQHYTLFTAGSDISRGYYNHRIRSCFIMHWTETTIGYIYLCACALWMTFKLCNYVSDEVISLQDLLTYRWNFGW